REVSRNRSVGSLEEEEFVVSMQDSWMDTRRIGREEGRDEGRTEGCAEEAARNLGGRAGGQTRVIPPSTTISSPVMKVASSARKRTAFATSSGVPKRLSGMRSMSPSAKPFTASAGIPSLP